ncbi:hypothetical protein [Aequorivita marisscotiae]|uniref:NolW-like domain-containing protein n=1 Tax=Aequorivita marisscotiae TaxID=3040348 RepID=A0ABY8L0U0_9FLAO|nr:hypothetical protein [Aequorivita sp. Ant34-E75]WGF93920.1 hypothetical protein QCQ61_06955 [Aequorivita sp. Ant34-E75]
MNCKWYIPVFILALAFFGISLEQTTLPNQEIVVEFNTDSVSASEAEQAIASVTSQLKSIGIAHISVSEIHDGKLKVTYYSETDVATVKGLFSKQHQFQLADTGLNTTDTSSKNPVSNDSHIYKLNVVTIQKDSGANLGLKGVLVVVKSAKDQYLKPFSTVGVSETNIASNQFFEIVVYKNYRTVSLLIDHTSYKIPEVRAGPIS